MNLTLKSPKIRDIVLLALIVLGIFIFVNYGNEEILRCGNYSDQFYYKLYYEELLNSPYFEPGYILLTNIGKRIGLDYLQFKLVLVSISFFFIFKCISGFNINYLYLLLLYFLSAFPSDLEQTRSFFAMSLVLYALKLFRKVDKSKKDYVIYVFLIFAASSIHGSTIVFLLMLLIEKLRANNRGMFIFIVSLVLSLFVYMIPPLKNVAQSLMFFVTGNNRVEMWFGYNTGLGFYVCLLLHIVLMCLLFRQRKSINSSVFKREYGFVDDMYCSLQILSIMFPLYLISTEFIRVFRGLFLIYFVAILVGAETIDRQNNTNKNTLIYGSVLLIYALLYAVIFSAYKIILEYYEKILIFEHLL